MFNDIIQVGLGWTIEAGSAKVINHFLLNQQQQEEHIAVED